MVTFLHITIIRRPIFHLQKSGNRLKVRSEKSGISIEADTDELKATLPENSPFHDWKEARRFAGPLPFTFTYNSKKEEVLIIEGVREHWIPKPIIVLSHEMAFIKDLNIPEIRLANAFIIENIPYYWKKGKIETWKKP